MSDDILKVAEKAYEKHRYDVKWTAFYRGFLEGSLYEIEKQLEATKENAKKEDEKWISL